MLEGFQITCKNSPPLPLILRSPTGLSILCEWSLKHKTLDVMALLKLCLAFLQFQLLKVWSYVCNLDVSIFSIQFASINL